MAQLVECYTIGIIRGLNHGLFVALDSGHINFSCQSWQSC